MQAANKQINQSFFLLNNTMSLYLWVQNIAYIQILLNYYYYWSKSPANLNIDAVITSTAAGVETASPAPDCVYERQ